MVDILRSEGNTKVVADSTYQNGNRGSGNDMLWELHYNNKEDDDGNNNGDDIFLYQKFRNWVVT